MTAPSPTRASGDVKPVRFEVAPGHVSWALLYEPPGDVPRRVNEASDYLASLTAADEPSNTRRARAMDLAMWFGWCLGTDRDWTATGTNDLTDWLLRLRLVPQRHPLSGRARVLHSERSARSPSTVARALHSVKAFYSWSYDAELVSRWVADRVAALSRTASPPAQDSRSPGAPRGGGFTCGSSPAASRGGRRRMHAFRWLTPQRDIGPQVRGRALGDDNRIRRRPVVQTATWTYCEESLARSESTSSRRVTAKLNFLGDCVIEKRSLTHRVSEIASTCTSSTACARNSMSRRARQPLVDLEIGDGASAPQDRPVSAP
jgi:hypothetical protein